MAFAAPRDGAPATPRGGGATWRVAPAGDDCTTPFPTPRGGPGAGLHPEVPRLSLLEASQAAARIRRSRAVVPLGRGDTAPGSPRSPRDGGATATTPRELLSAKWLDAAEAGAVLSSPRGGGADQAVKAVNPGARVPPHPGGFTRAPRPVDGPHAGEPHGGGGGAAPRAEFSCCGIALCPSLFRVPTQMAVASAVAAALFVFQTPHSFFRGTGLWTCITIVLVLEPNSGSTAKKARLRLAGTALGGAFGGGIVALARWVNGSWVTPPGADALPKSLTVCLAIAASCWLMQFLRGWDTRREYAYTVAMITLTVASLSDFYSDDWTVVRLAVWWRCCTIVTGVFICTLAGALILPVYASDVARATLGECLSCVAALLSGVVDVYTATATPCDERRAALHELEGQLCGAVERLRPLMAQAQEESLCCGLLAGGRPLAGLAFAAACGRARLLYTGAVALLHFEESLGDGQEALGLCARHAGGVHAARDALGVAMRAAAAGIASNVDLSAHALSCDLEAAETAVSALLRAVSGATTGGGGSAGELEALGHLCFALADALAQLKQLVVDLDPVDGATAVAALEKRAAAAVHEAAEQPEDASAKQQQSPLMARATRRMSVIDRGAHVDQI